ncbi:MAG: sulfite exporter TauE/SafE family protein [Acidobacteria bacterium]|nr:sulfite exporter TauE/SafE family protein [Acidobacteriota bacterium]
MNIYLPVAAMDINILWVACAGIGVGFVQGLLGSGGFLLTPILIMMGVNPAVATASGINAIAGASVSGAIAHLRVGNVDIGIGLLMLVGGVSGGALGTWIVKLLRAVGNLDLVIVSCYVVLMAVIGVMVFIEGITSQVRGEPASGEPSRVVRLLQRLPLQMRFKAAGVQTSALAPFLLGAFVGVLAAIMGVGGGFVLIPAMTYLLDMPMQVVVGTSLFQMLFTSSSVTLMQAAMNHTVDVVLAAILLIGSTLGAQLGARAAQKLRADQLKVVFSLLVLAMSVKMLNGLLAAPAFLLQELVGRR